MHRLRFIGLVLALATTVHVDWHFARPTHHRLSLGWDQHWMFAMLAFALVGWVIARTWPDRVWQMGGAIAGLALLIAQVIEPISEVALYQHRVGYPNEPARWMAFLMCVVAGLPVYCLALLYCREGQSRRVATAVRARHLFLALCVVGLVLPNAAFWPWIATHGFAPRQFITDLFANGVSAFFGLDVVFAALALIAFVEIEGRRLGLRHRWMPIAATCLIGVSLGLPLFLYQRQAHFDRAAA